MDVTQPVARSTIAEAIASGLSIETPALVADEPVVRANIARMQASMDGRGIALRPHAKTHKSLEVGLLQLKAGAAGLTMGTIGEAEVFSSLGDVDLFIAYPLWVSDAKAGRIRRLVKEARVSVGLDSVEAAERIVDVLAEERGAVRVLIEIDSGEHRSGVPPEEAGDVCAAASRLGLDVAGVFTHGGHAYRGRDKVAGAADDEVAALEAAVSSVRAAGFDTAVVSAGSTPTARSSARPPITEERPGTYVFGDRQQLALGACSTNDLALFVTATVVSVDRLAGRATLDAGAKSLSKDRKDWLEGFGQIVGRPAARIVELFDYHGVVELRGEPAIERGEVVAIVPNHVCPVVNLFDRIELIAEGELTGRWLVDARGRSS